MNRAPHVVLDTNVVLSALLFAQGRLAAIRLAWQHGRCRPLASKATIAELLRVLAYPKFGLTAEQQEELLADYLPHCTIVRTPATPPHTPPCRDPYDLPFLRLAASGKADYLVTGDKDLLEVSGKTSYSIITADKFLALISARPV
jgi:putative PIN family toxin of toxin-antitoxin system